MTVIFKSDAARKTVVFPDSFVRTLCMVRRLMAEQDYFEDRARFCSNRTVLRFLNVYHDEITVTIMGA